MKEFLSWHPIMTIQIQLLVLILIQLMTLIAILRKRT